VWLSVGSRQIKNAANKSSKLYSPRFWGHVHKATKFGHVGMIGRTFTYLIQFLLAFSLAQLKKKKWNSPITSPLLHIEHGRAWHYFHLPSRACGGKINLPGTVFFSFFFFFGCLNHSLHAPTKTPKPTNKQQSKTAVHSFMYALEIHAVCGG